VGTNEDKAAGADDGCCVVPRETASAFV